jgi:hypothetical protein
MFLMLLLFATVGHSSCDYNSLEANDTLFITNNNKSIVFNTNVTSQKCSYKLKVIFNCHYSYKIEIDKDLTTCDTKTCLTECPCTSVLNKNITIMIIEEIPANKVCVINYESYIYRECAHDNVTMIITLIIISLIAFVLILLGVCCFIDNYSKLISADFLHKK